MYKGWKKKKVSNCDSGYSSLALPVHELSYLLLNPLRRLHFMLVTADGIRKLQRP